MGEMKSGWNRENGSSSRTSSVDGWVDRALVFVGWNNGCSSSSSPGLSTSPSFPSSQTFSSSRASACVSYIEHRVSRMDTLAGVAIKYGVEVADIRRLNALVTDRQMFAHELIKIPLPGRHPPSTTMSNGSTSNEDGSPKQQPKIDFWGSSQSATPDAPPRRVTHASLQGYYGRVTPESNPTPEGTDMAAYVTARMLCLEDEPLPIASHISDQYPVFIGDLRSRMSGFPLENGDAAQTTDIRGEGEIDRTNSDRSIRRRQKIDADMPCRTPEVLLEDDATLSGRTGKSIAPRPRSGSRTDLDSSFLTAISNGDSSTANSFAVRKSSSTPSLQEPENGHSKWPTSKWTLKPDVIAKPLFDGFPKPMAVWRSKAALD